jgi:hypothetical protein
MISAAMVEQMTGQIGKWTKPLKPVFKCNARYGKLSVEERNQNMLEVEKNLMSEETAMSLNSIDDVLAERAIILGQATSQLDLRKRQAEVAEIWSQFLPRDVALQLSGLPDDEVKKIMKDVAAASVEDDPAKREVKADAAAAKAVPAKAPGGGKQPNAKPKQAKGGSGGGKKTKPQTSA